jgi:hypothetical protein
MTSPQIGDVVLKGNALCEVVAVVTHVEKVDTVTGEVLRIPLRSVAYRLRMVEQMPDVWGKTTSANARRKPGHLLVAFADELLTPAAWLEKRQAYTQNNRDCVALARRYKKGGRYV